MAMESNDAELVAAIKGLSKNQKMLLSVRYSEAYLTQLFDQIRENIAIAMKTRVQSKIATYFTAGYATGALFDSIYYTIVGSTITVKSTKNYFNILNAGYDSFDMKDALSGNDHVKIRLPGGRIIYRKCGDQSQQESATRKNLTFGSSRIDGEGKKIRNARGNVSKYMKQSYSAKNWIHPGYQGRHVMQVVEQEMSYWVKNYVNNEIMMLLSTVPDTPFAQTQEGYIFYNRRNQKGQFSQ
jgi:hypothetical protein